MIRVRVAVAKNIRSVAEENSRGELKMKQKLKELSREKLVEILCNMADILQKEQYTILEKLVEEAETDNSAAENYPVMVRMSQELVDEKIEQIKGRMQQIDTGELYLDTES